MEGGGEKVWRRVVRLCVRALRRICHGAGGGEVGCCRCVGFGREGGEVIVGLECLDLTWGFGMESSCMSESLRTVARVWVFAGSRLRSVEGWV